MISPLKYDVIFATGCKFLSELRSPKKNNLPTSSSLIIDFIPKVNYKALDT